MTLVEIMWTLNIAIFRSKVSTWKAEVGTHVHTQTHTHTKNENKMQAGCWWTPLILALGEVEVG